MSDSFEYILTCQICLEDFEETGEHVPRLLPCSHTLCQGCLKELIEVNVLECPECRKKHGVFGNGVKTFPQNKYILAHIRKKEADIVKNDQMSETLSQCEEHGKELVLYCQECLISICLPCLTRNHRGHDVIEIEEAERETLLARIEVFVNDLEERKGNIFEVEKNTEEERMECVKKIKARKEELIQMIDQRHEQMLADVEQKKKTDFTEELIIIEEHLNLLKNVRDIVDKEVVTQEEIKAVMETVISLEESIKHHLPSKVEYKLLGFMGGLSVSTDGDRLYGCVRESTKYLPLERNVRYTWKGNE